MVATNSDREANAPGELVTLPAQLVERICSALSEQNPLTQQIRQIWRPQIGDNTAAERAKSRYDVDHFPDTWEELPEDERQLLADMESWPYIWGVLTEKERRELVVNAATILGQ